MAQSFCGRHHEITQSDVNGRNPRCLASSISRRYSSLIICLCVVSTWSPAIGQSKDVAFNIQAEPLAHALVDLAIQAKISVGHAGIDFKDVIANSVQGRKTNQQALATLLDGTGYRYVFLDQQTVAIRQDTISKPALTASELLEEVVVTATKRPAISQSLPDSIVVVTGAALQDRGSTVSNDLTGQVAALTATNLGAGQDKLFIRGLSDSVLTGRSQSTVGLYLDEARMTDDAPDPGLRLVDISQVEVVRGPQGTLYGAGTLGGLIRIITNKPVLDQFEGTAAASAATTDGGGPSGSADLMFNVPILEDILGLRIVGYVASNGGYIEDNRLGLNDVNHSDTRGARLSLRWLPQDDWIITLAVIDQTISAADSQYYQAGFPAYTRANFVQEPHQDSFLQTDLTAETPTDWGALTATSAYTERRIADQYDASLAWPSLTGLPIGRSIFQDVRDIRSLTHETRLTSAIESRWSWVSGLFLSSRDEHYRSRLVGPEGDGVAVLARAEVRTDHAYEAASFGEATYRMADWLAVTAGARLFYTSLDASADLRRLASGAAPAAGSNDATGITRKLVLNIRPEENLTFYADAAEGFRLGGININGPAGAANGTSGRDQDGPSANTFASDSLWTYELGAKTSFLNGRLIANAAAYITSWHNVQSDQILQDGTLYIANVGDVRDPGFETDIDFQATPHLRLEGNFFWNDPKIVHANPLLIQTSGRLPGVPQSSFGLTARYDMPLGDASDVFIGADYAYVGKSYAGFDARNSPVMGDYFIGDVRLGILRDQWQATVYIDNVAVERSNSFAYGNPFSFGKIGQITPLRPQTIGFGISRSF